MLPKTEATNCLQCQAQKAQRNDQFICPCGKNYRSYPALYKHIKNKHHGQPPGHLNQPNKLPKKRGRPPVYQPRTPLYSKQATLSETESHILLSEVDIRGRLIQRGHDCILKMGNILRQLPAQSINKSHFHELTSVLEMNIYLLKDGQQKEGRDTIGGRLAELLQQLSKQIEWSSLEHFFTLLLVFLQSIIDARHDKHIIRQGHVDILCNYLNQFIENRVHLLIKGYQIATLSIFKEEIMLYLFEQVFRWLFLKEYTQYKVTLNSRFQEDH